MALACDISASLRDFEFVAPEAARPLYEASRSPCNVQQRGIFSLVFHTDRFDPMTGNFSARYDASRNPAPKGDKTVEVLGLDRRESLAAGHQKAYKHISALIAEAAASSTADATTLIASLKVMDEYGLLGWCFRGTGINERPMSSLRRAFPGVWAECVKAFKNT